MARVKTSRVLSQKRIRQKGSDKTLSPLVSYARFWNFVVAVVVALMGVAIIWLAETTPTTTPNSPVTAERDNVKVGSVAIRKGGFSKTDIADIFTIEKQVWADSKNPHLSNQSRVFGEKTDGSKGHIATYLHAHVGSTPQGQALMEKLFRITMELEQEAGWGIASSGLFKTLHPRAAESIRYTNDHGNEAKGAVEIGWHSDFMSVMTVSVMLSPSEAFNGGSFQTRRLGPDDGTHTHSLDIGDVTVWKSWDRHRVEPLTGLRNVFVVQWWLAPAHTETRSGPAPSHHFLEGPDLLLRYCKALETIDPTSYYAAQICGKYVAKVADNVQDPHKSTRLLKTSLAYHKHASVIANESNMLRQPLLSMAERLSKTYFARGVKPELKNIHHVLELCEQIHLLGEAGKESPFDREMAKELPPVGQQKDMGGTVLHLLKQVIGVKALNFGPYSKFERRYPFLKLYWSQ